MRKLLFFCLLMFLSSWSVAQVQPQPRESEPQDRQMPNYLPDEAPADIPNMEFLRGHGTDPVTGEPHYYMDPESGLYFDFREKIIRDFKTGKAYTFKELEKLLRKEPEKPEVPKKSRI